MFFSIFFPAQAGRAGPGGSWDQKNNFSDVFYEIALNLAWAAQNHPKNMWDHPLFFGCYFSVFFFDIFRYLSIFLYKSHMGPHFDHKGPGFDVFFQ